MYKNLKVSIMAKKLVGWKYDEVKLVRISDADTILVEVSKDIGFNVKTSTTIKLRIRNFDAAETWRPRNDLERVHGNAATKLAHELLDGKTFGVTTYKLGKYGRYEADITLADGSDFVETMNLAGMAKKASYDE